MDVEQEADPLEQKPLTPKEQRRLQTLRQLAVQHAVEQKGYPLTHTQLQQYERLVAREARHLMQQPAAAAQGGEPSSRSAGGAGAVQAQGRPITRSLARTFAAT